MSLLIAKKIGNRIMFRDLSSQQQMKKKCYARRSNVQRGIDIGIEKQSMGQDINP